jgi:hypothetical protein
MSTIQLGAIGSTPTFTNEFLFSGESDVFVMDVAGSTTHINLGLRSGITSGKTRLRLTEDTNRNGVFDSADRTIGSIGGASNDAMVHSRATGAGRYFATVTNSDGLAFSYNLRATASKPSNIFDPTPFENLGSITFDRELTRSVSNGQATSTFAFSLNSTSGVNISLTNSDGDVDMRLIRDFNGNGVVDNGEEIARSALGGTATDRINNVTGAGSYILQAYQFAPGFLRYRLNLDHFTTNAAGPANSEAEREFRVGKITKDLSRRGVLNENNPGDSYAFSLDADQSIDLRLKERSGDSYLRIVQDRNNDGIIQRREVIRTSVGSGNLEQVLGMSGKGNYIAQVWQVGDDTARYTLNFDVPPVNAVPGVTAKG